MKEDPDDIYYERDSLQRKMVDMESENQQYQREWKARNEEQKWFEYSLQDLEQRYDRIFKALVAFIGESKANKIAEGDN